MSWFWGDADAAGLMQSRFTAPPRACGKNTPGLESDAIPRADGYLKALQDNQTNSKSKTKSLIGGRWPDPQ
ncbi:MAG: hypothetical protein HY923_11305 [Elusimicrobia bacterium]|nr:hypothetical protein [Elusimicrobiota bacterium]